MERIGLAFSASPYFVEVKAVMELKNLDRLQQVKELIKGLRDTMFYMEMAQQDILIPITILVPFEAVLEKIYLLLEEMEKKEAETR